MVPASPTVTMLPAPDPDDLTSGFAHPTIHARAVHGGAWKILSSWARAS